MIQKSIALTFISTIFTIACLAQSNQIQSTGNVGIGTTSPTAHLTLYILKQQETINLLVEKTAHL